MEIIPRSKLSDVLKAYPELEEVIIGVAPPFKNLKNPVLRRTVGQLATLSQVAQIGGMDAIELVNALRRRVGQPELVQSASAPLEWESSIAPGDPDWISGEPQFVVDGTALLARGEAPLERVNALLGELEPGRTILLLTSFEPLPIFDAMAKQGRRFYHKTHIQDPAQHLTFIG
jgi:hypothetical protein